MVSLYRCIDKDRIDLKSKNANIKSFINGNNKEEEDKIFLVEIIKIVKRIWLGIINLENIETFVITFINRMIINKMPKIRINSFNGLFCKLLMILI